MRANLARTSLILLTIVLFAVEASEPNELKDKAQLNLIEEMKESLRLNLQKHLSKETLNIRYKSKHKSKHTRKKNQKKKIIAKRKKIIEPPKVKKGFHTIKMYGSIKDEYYYINLYVGTPPQRQSVIVDTGSDFTAFPCNKCPDGQCGKHIDPYFQTKKSSTLKRMKCGGRFMETQCRKCDLDGNCFFRRMYAEENGSGKGLFGHVFTDIVTVGDAVDNDDGTSQARILKPSRMMIGCTENEPGLFKTQRANGITGLKSISSNFFFEPNLMDIFSKSRQVVDDSFSLCHGDVGGYLTLGGFNIAKHVQGERVQSFRWKAGKNYGIDIKNFYVEGEESTEILEGIDYNWMIDSGTTYIWLPQAVYNGFVRQMKLFCKKAGKCKGMNGEFEDKCILYSKAKNGPIEDYVNTYPVFYFKLGSRGEALFKLFPREWLVRYPVEGRPGQFKLCPAFRNGKRMVKYLIGNQFLKHYDFHFDRKRRVVSFVRSQCDEGGLKLRSFSSKIRRILVSVDGGISYPGCFGVLLLGLLGAYGFKFGFSKNKNHLQL